MLRQQRVRVVQAATCHLSSSQARCGGYIHVTPGGGGVHVTPGWGEGCTARQVGEGCTSRYVGVWGVHLSVLAWKGGGTRHDRCGEIGRHGPTTLS